MSRGVNKVILVGSLGQDPEVRYSQAGAAMTSISVATNESWKDKVTGEKQERTEWHRVKFFGRLAEIAGEYLKKGGQVYIEGSLRTEKYTDKQGVEKYSTDIIASEMQMLGGGRRDDDGDRDERTQRSSNQNTSRGSNGNGNGNQSGRGNGGSNNNGNGGRGYGNNSTGGGYGGQQQRREEPAMAGAAGAFPDDDIPF